MRAVVIRETGDPSVLAIEDVADPVPAPGEVLIRVSATALNRADLLQRRGFYPPPAGTDPRIPGLECAGTVVESRDPAGRFKAGDRLMALLPGAGYAELVAISADLVLPVPDRLDLQQAAAVPEVFLTAYDALFLQLQISMGETVLIHAVGSGVGTAAVQLLRTAGVRTIGTSRTAAKLAACAALGLDHGIEAGTGDWAEEVEDLTAGRGVDAILDLAGGGYLKGNLQALSERGRMIVVGIPAGSRSELDLGLLLRKRLQLRGTNLRRRTPLERADLVSRFHQNALPLLAAGSLAPVIDRVFPWSEAAAAHALMEANRNFGKIVLAVR